MQNSSNNFEILFEQAHNRGDTMKDIKKKTEPRCEKAPLRWGGITTLQSKILARPLL